MEGYLIGIATDPSGNAVVAGYYHPGGNSIWMVRKYRSSDGQLLWEKTWDYGYGSDARDVATDGAGNIYICGAYPDPNYHDWEIIKYSPSGSVLWETSFDAVGHGNPLGIATDPSGDAIVAGYYHPSGNNIWIVRKYKSSDGQLLWSKTWDYGYGSDAQDVATDGAGNICVCGSYPNPNNHDEKIITYSSNGSIITEYPGWDIGEEDIPYDIAVNGQYFYAAGVTNAYGDWDWVIQKDKVVGVEEESGFDAPGLFCLSQNSPNPVYNETQIPFGMPKDEYVVLKIYDLSGKSIYTLINGAVKSGLHTVNWNGTDNNGKKVASGIYFYRLEAGNFKATRKLTVLR